VIDIQIETKEVQTMLNRLLKKVENPKKLMRNVQRWINYLTMKMFRGARPDNSQVRGVKWPQLADSTLQQKRAKVKRGASLVAARPMVDTGTLRDSLKVLQEDKDGGFIYGTKTKSKKGFSYPGFHNAGRFPWLFIRKTEFPQMQQMTVDYLEGKIKSFKSYAK